MSLDDQLQHLSQLRERAALGGGQERIDRQHSSGKLTARERLKLLVDPGSFEEFDSLAIDEYSATAEGFFGDAVITGWGTIDGRPIYVFAQDFTVYGGSLGEVVGRKITKVMDLALRNGAPIVARSGKTHSSTSKPGNWLAICSSRSRQSRSADVVRRVSFKS